MPMRRPGGRTPDLYELLGISRGASRADISRAYRRQARAIHPDSHPQETHASAQFRDLTEAYQILSNPARRADYDRALRLGPTGRPPAPPPDPARSRVQPDPAPRSRVAPDPAVRLRMPSDPAAQLRMPPLWIGPVQVDPPAVPTGGGRRGEDESLAALAELLASYFGHRPGWPW
jgi:curved DNA-binding protein CbpA